MRYYFNAKNKDFNYRKPLDDPTPSPKKNSLCFFCKWHAVPNN